MQKQLIKINNLSRQFSKTDKFALDCINAEIPSGKITGLVGPDGAGKTTLIRTVAGLLLPTSGIITVNGFDSIKEADEIQSIISYMPQKFGLYEDLTVIENLNLYADLKNVTGDERKSRFEILLKFTDLNRFTRRLAGALSGGMKQKLGLACCLIKKPQLLLLDEPSVGVDPISRRELWSMVKELVDDEMGVIWSTAYLDEAEKCDNVLLLNEGQLCFHGIPSELYERVKNRTFQIQNIEGSNRKALTTALNNNKVIDGIIQGNNVRIVTRKENIFPSNQELSSGINLKIIKVEPRFEDAFIDILGGGPGGKSLLSEKMQIIPEYNKDIIVTTGLTKTFGDFTAADNISFSVKQGEIFGLLGPNGAGKSTTFKMMCGLLKPTSGTARIVGYDLRTASGEARSKLGYMAQKFSLYDNLSILQNLNFFAGIYGLSGKQKREKIEQMVQIFDLKQYFNDSAGGLPLGFKQRLALACAVMHNPPVLFLDEPTSGVDPITRREFWVHINGLVQKGVTIVITTHFMDEAEYCDRIGLVYRSRLIAMGSPDELKSRIRSEIIPDPTLEDTFIELIRIKETQRQAT